MGNHSPKSQGSDSCFKFKCYTRQIWSLCLSVFSSKYLVPSCLVHIHQQSKRLEYLNNGIQSTQEKFLGEYFNQNQVQISYRHDFLLNKISSASCPRGMAYVNLVKFPFLDVNVWTIAHISWVGYVLQQLATSQTFRLQIYCCKRMDERV